MSDFSDYFDQEYLPKLGKRGSTFRAVLREAEHQQAQSIVETGSIRLKDNWLGDGQSTVIWNRYALFEFATFETVDASEEAQKLVQEMQLGNTNAFCMDSVKFLSGTTARIDLLYLDSYDLDMDNMHPAAMHCMFEFTAAMPRLGKGSIVFIDDSPITDTGFVVGKGLYVAQYFKHLGILPFATGYQAAWLIP